MSRLPRARLAVAVVAAATVITACSGAGGGSPEADDTSTGPTQSGPTKVKPPPKAPKVGECRALSFAAISLYSNDTKPAACDKPHTAFTYDVAELPSDIAFDGVEIQNNAVQDAAATACQSSYAKYVGGSTETRVLARLTVTYFLPEQAGFDAGAHWVRCDIVALQSDSSLGELPQKLEGFLDGDNALDAYGVCSQGDPAKAGSALVTCSQDHTYRAVTAIRIGESDAEYPGESAARESGQQDCEDFIKDLLGVSGGFTYSWTYPSSANWADGQRFGFCWNEDGTGDAE